MSIHPAGYDAPNRGRLPEKTRVGRTIIDAETSRRIDELIAAGYTLEDRGGDGERLFYPPNAIPGDPGLPNVHDAYRHLELARRTFLDRLFGAVEAGDGYVPELSTRLVAPPTDEPEST